MSVLGDAQGPSVDELTIERRRGDFYMQRWLVARLHLDEIANAIAEFGDQPAIAQSLIGDSVQRYEAWIARQP